MKPVVVQKYGGSSVADVDRLKLVAQRVVDTVDAGHRVVVVLSAMGDTTDELLRLANRMNDAPPRRELDMLVSAGERIASALLAMAIEGLGHRAVSFTGSQCGIITTHRHTDARILEVRPYRVQDELDDGRVVIIAGYQGVSYKREVTTLGRGGSDTTAVAMAAALGAEYCEICSDVDGVYTADPRIVPGAQHLESLDYDRMHALASHGAKVLNAEAVEFARQHQIAIFARATAGSTKVTRIDGTPTPHSVGITGLGDICRISGEGGAAQLAAIEDYLGALAIVPLWARLNGRSVQVVAPMAMGADSAKEGLETALETLGGTAEFGLEAVTVVGHRPEGRPQPLSALMAAVETAGAEVLAVDSRHLRQTALVGAGKLDSVLRELHSVLFSSD